MASGGQGYSPRTPRRLRDARPADRDPSHTGGDQTAPLPVCQGVISMPLWHIGKRTAAGNPDRTHSHSAEPISVTYAH